MFLSIENHHLARDVSRDLLISDGEIECVKNYMEKPEIMDAPVHGWTHTLHMLTYATHLRRHSAFDARMVKYAILLHDAGRVTDVGPDPGHGERAGVLLFQLAAATQLFDDMDLEILSLIMARHCKSDESIWQEESILRACDRLDLWRLENFQGCNPELMEAAGWSRVEAIARRLRRGK